MDRHGASALNPLDPTLFRRGGKRRGKRHAVTLPL